METSSSSHTQVARHRALFRGPRETWHETGCAGEPGPHDGVQLLEGGQGLLQLAQWQVCWRTHAALSAGTQVGMGPCAVAPGRPDRAREGARGGGSEGVAVLRGCVSFLLPLLLPVSRCPALCTCPVPASRLAPACSAPLPPAAGASRRFCGSQTTQSRGQRQRAAKSRWGVANGFKIRWDASRCICRRLLNTCLRVSGRRRAPAFAGRAWSASPPGGL